MGLRKKLMEERMTSCRNVTLATMLTLGLLVASTAAQTPLPLEQGRIVIPAVRIDAGDLIECSAVNAPDIAGKFRVNEKGDISLPFAGQYHVAGQSVSEAQAGIGSLFVEKGILTVEGSQVLVNIIEYSSQGVTVSGEVRSPGVYSSLGMRYLNDILTAAGGLNPTAATYVEIAHHGEQVASEKVPYNPTANPPVVPAKQIFPGDNIFVPKIGVVYAVGNWGHAGAFPLDQHEKVTIEKLYGLAGGATRASQLKTARLVRIKEDGSKEMVSVDLVAILKGKTGDIDLRDGDILYIAPSSVKMVAQRSVELMTSIGLMAMTYRVFYR